jgi:hypothetical protein
MSVRDRRRRGEIGALAASQAKLPNRLPSIVLRMRDAACQCGNNSDGGPQLQVGTYQLPLVQD